MKTTVTSHAQNGIYSDLFSGFALTYCNSKHIAQKQAIVTLLSGLHTANLSWPSRVGRLQNVGQLVPSHVKLNNANINLQYGIGRRSAVTFTQPLCLGLILS